MEYAVKAETPEGQIVTLRRGFSSTEDAEDHRVKLSQWRRVWVEEVEERRKFTRKSRGISPDVPYRGKSGPFFFGLAPKVTPRR
jgi:hypothetical protein